MATLDNILTLLDKWPRWKRINEIPEQMDELLQRIAALEERLERAPGEACPYCGALAMRMTSQRMNGQWEIWTCGECEKTKDVRHDLNATNRAGR